MSRYVVIRAGVKRWLEDDAQPCDWTGGHEGGKTVHEVGEGVINTGILDADGNSIGRITKQPLGFDLTRA